MKPWQATSIILTSGTTGVSKGVICSYFQLYLSSTALLGHLQSGDRCYSYMPFFHIGGLGAVYAAIVRRAAVAVVQSFKTERFWSDIRRMECNACCGIFNSVVQFLSKRPMKDDERSLLTRPVPMAPVDAAAITLAKNYGFDYYTGFGMSEAPMPLASPMNPVAGKGYCGHPRQGLTCRVVDGNDIECPPGTTGELVLRSNLPWDLTVGYLHNDAATAAAFRNGWFHTGDAFRRESDGSFYFVDRLKDSIRRRGENISSQEVEFAVIGHPDVLDAAAYAVPSDNAEDEVMVAIEAKPGRQIDFAGLTEHLRDRLPHFMVPDSCASYRVCPHADGQGPEGDAADGGQSSRRMGSRGARHQDQAPGPVTTLQMRSAPVRHRKHAALFQPVHQPRGDVATVGLEHHHVPVAMNAFLTQRDVVHSSTAFREPFNGWAVNGNRMVDVVRRLQYSDALAS